MFGLFGSGDKLRREMCRQPLDDVGEPDDLLFAQGVDLVMEQLDFELRLDVDAVVVFCVFAVDLRLPVLAHHDDGRGIGGLEGQDQVQQDKGIRVPVTEIRYEVQDGPCAEDDGLDDDKAPGADGSGKPVGDDRAARGRGFGRVAGGILRPELSQAPIVFGAHPLSWSRIVFVIMGYPQRKSPPQG